MNVRPDPDALLARAQAEEAGYKRGRLKIFIGAAAGVGKTFAMLEEARMLRKAGVDVVVGYVEPHGRPDTERLLEGLEPIPTRTVNYRGATLREFDLDAALARKPKLVLLDELAHTNAEGSRHPKRWQDALELLDAGIDVTTTVNVQHIESLNDVVAQITGVIVRETVPDSVIEQADQIELIDLTPEELVKRLKDGKVYKPAQVDQALRGFFRLGNLTALRELALRQTADRVNREVQDYRQAHRIENTWPTAERLLVALGPGEGTLRLVRAAHRMAQSLRAQWVAVFVDTGARLSTAHRDAVHQALQLAEQLGAETATLSGTNVSEELINYARQRNVSKLVVGKPARPRWQEIVFGSRVNDLVRNSGLVDVYVIHGEHDDTESSQPALLQRTSPLRQYGLAIAVFVIATIVATLADRLGFGEANVVMTYLLGVVIVAFYIGRGPAVLTAIISVLAFNISFVTPRGTLAVSDTRYLLTFAVMITVGLVISTLASRIKQQAEVSRQRERRTAELYEMSREFAGTPAVETLAQIAERHIGSVFDASVMVLLPDDKSQLEAGGWTERSTEERTALANEQGVAQWSFDHRQEAGRGTNTLAGARALYLPLLGTRGTVGVVSVLPCEASDDRLQSPDQLHLLETFVNQTALAIERAQLDKEAQAARAQMETEQMRNSLLSSVSHDLRTPLATIQGAASSMLDAGASMDAGTRDELTQSIHDEAERLNRLVTNLLEMTRLQSGATQLKKEWLDVEEVIGSALHRMASQLNGRPLRVDVPDNLPIASFDGVLIEQVLINLLDNAVKYSPAGSPIDIAAQRSAEGVQISIRDRGQGLAAGDEQRVFDRFYRADTSLVGAGLGLSICKGIVDAHGGKIWAESRAGGGAIFNFTLPIEGNPPQMPALDGD
jgi:two-component system sensor histidine kinase KdpD